MQLVERRNREKESFAIRLKILCCAVLNVLAQGESISLNSLSRVSASKFTWMKSNYLALQP